MSQSNQTMKVGTKNKQCNSAVDFLGGGLANIPKEFKRHKKGKALSVAARQTIMNVYFSLSATYPNETFCKIVKKTAEMTGVSEKTIWRVKKEHTELNGKFKEPANKRDLMLGKKIRLARYDEVALSGIKNVVYDFISRNEIPTCKKLLEIVNSDESLPNFGSVRTFHRLLKDMGYDAKYQLHVNLDAVKNPPKKRDNAKNKPKLGGNLLVKVNNKSKNLNKPTTVDEINFEVKEVKTVDYESSKIVYREDCLTLYEMKMQLEKIIYELIIFAPMSMIEKPVKGFSLFRVEDKQEAIRQFFLFKKILPIYYNCTPQLLICKNLKELCEVVRNNPTWTIAHIVASLGWQSCVRYDILENLLNEVCPNSLETPIIIAVKFKRLEVIRSLMNFNINIRSTDNKGNNVYHYAANTTREIINALQCYDTPSVINNKNIEGFTPLQIACMNNNTDCIIELLESNADMNFTPVTNNQYILPPVYRSKNNPRFSNDPTKLSVNGGTPLHCADKVNCLEALLSFGCNIEAKNYSGDTALHINVTKNSLDCVICLLSHGANPNSVSANGDTPLHIAVKVGNPFIIKALSLFGANANVFNMEGFTPRHLAATRNDANGNMILFILQFMGSSRCSTHFPSCTSGCSPIGDCNGLAPQKLLHLCKTRLLNNLMQLPMKNLVVNSTLNQQLPKQKLCRVLCIDSGGNKAPISLQIISSLEASLGSCITSNFDFIVGTGMGALLALSLALGKTVRQCQGLLLKLKDKLYVNANVNVNVNDKFDQTKLDRFLQKEFGETLLMSDIKNVRLMLIGVLEERNPAEIVCFRNYASPSTVLGQHDVGESVYNYPIWQVARAACSRFLIEDNSSLLKDDCAFNLPCLDALTEIQERNIALNTMNQEDQIEAIDIMISVGSGLNPINFGEEPLNFIDKMTISENRLVERTQAICSLAGIPFYRINPPLTDFIIPDSCNTELIIKAMWETSFMLNSKITEFMELAKLILK